MRRSSGILLGALLASVSLVPAQDALVRELATGDVVAVEHARRRVVSGDAARVPVAALTQLLRSPEASRRLAAGSALLHHGLAEAAVAAWLRDERDPAVLEPVVADLDADVLLRIVRTGFRSAPADDRDDFGIDRAARLHARALGRLLDLGRVDDELWRLALASAEPDFADSAARLCAEEAWPFPRPVVGELTGVARRAMLEALADRPRPEAEEWLARLLAKGSLEPAERLLAMLGTPPENWSRDVMRVLPDDVRSADLDLRSLATRACDLLPERQAERLVGEVHRRAVEGVPLGDLLPALVRAGPRGERHLVGLARELPDADRAAIVDWLSARGSPVLDEIVTDALDDRYPLTPDLLLRAGPLLGEAGRVRRVVAILVDEDAEPALRIASFEALCDRGVLEDGMLAFALDPDGDPRSRVRGLTGMPPDALSAGQWGQVLDQAPFDVVRAVIARMVEAPVTIGLEPRLQALVASGEGLADTAAHVCLVAGREAFAREVWNLLTPERRVSLATSLRRRVGETWVIAALAEVVEPEGRFEVRFARIVVGDQEALREVIADPGEWPLSWLRRVHEVVRDALRPVDVTTVERLLVRGDLGAGHRRQLVRWIAERPDLGGTELLEQVHAEDPDEEVRYAAMRGLLRRDGPSARFRAAVSAAIPGGLDLEHRELAFEVLGSFETPLSADGCVLVARLALVAPLSQVDHELRAALRIDPVADVALLNAVWQAAGREPTPHLEAALDAAVAEARMHHNGAFAARYRLGRLLALLARTDRTREVAGPVARAVLEAPDLDPGFVGPACVILAEAAERDGDWSAAAELWRRAARGCLRTPPEPMLMRPFVGDAWRAEGRLPAAFLVARPHYCAARAALVAGDVDAAREALQAAEVLGSGDRETEREIRELEKEIPR